ncbi:MAG: acyl-CoA dehydrogenase, partial [Acidimicrobiia bacterium]|nr:acyl-CoA dehydrogenase [Acidimicrobiia bacterium]
MSIAISDDHRALAEVAAEVLTKRESRAAARAMLETDDERLPGLWADVVELGWLGLHLPEEFGGSGYGIEELAVVVEQHGRHVAPGPFVPTVIASASIASAGDDAAKTRLLPGLASGEATAGVALTGTITVADGRATGELPVVLGAGQAGLVVFPSGEDAVVVDVGDGVTVETPKNLDPTRRSGRVRLDDAPLTVLEGGARVFVDMARTLLAAEAAGVAADVTDQAAEYARNREQFGRVIGTFQAVKHHCANMAVTSEEAIAAVWDAARAAQAGGEQFTYAAAVAAAFAGPAAYLCANLNIQVHGGIGFTWAHDAHLYLRRALALQALLDSEAAAADVTDLARAGVERARAVDLPPEAETVRDEVRLFTDSVKDLEPDEQRRRLIETGYLVPNWPAPWGREAGAVQQLVIEEEFRAAGIDRKIDPITRYVMVTFISEATEDQVARWVPAALAREVTWCQLFSEPDAGSDAAGIKTRGVRTDGGWLVTGQKVWTSGARDATFGLATVRTNPDVPKHAGITTMVVDMSAPGVEIRPLRQPDGSAHFNEVFLNDVFVPDDDVIGPVDGGWQVARATLGNESISVGQNDSNMLLPTALMIGAYDAHPDRLPGGATRVGRWIGRQHTLGTLNVRRAARALAGGGPGPEGAVTKLLFAEIQHETAAIMALVGAPDLLYLDEAGMMPAL